MTIHRPWNFSIGLFGQTNGATIRNVGLVDADIEGYVGVGAFVGDAMNTQITQCYSKGTMTGHAETGGLVGWLDADSIVEDSYSAAQIAGEAPLYGLIVGEVEGTLHNVYSSGTTGTEAALLAYNWGNGTIEGSFFDCDLAGNCSEQGGSSTTAMQQESTYTGATWDFTNTWSLTGGNGYPCLRWQPACGGQSCSATDATCDGRDDDCDGNVDDDYVSTPTGCGVGACSRTGSTSCAAGSVRENCVPASPSPDVDCDGVDDDCDGSADEGFVSQVSHCGLGACASSGSTSCYAGALEDSCVAGSPGSDADCDAVDGDCDGTADEHYVGLTTTCGLGVCASTGTSSCASGAVLSECTPGLPTGTDADCDGFDQDCDGVADDAFPGSTTTCTVGGCAAHGTLACDGGTVDTCLTEPQCYAEVDCTDGSDNDHDGSPDCMDPDCAGEAGCHETVCGDGLDDELDGLVDCADPDCAGIGPCSAEICGNSLDDDTDGLLDCADPDCDGIGPCELTPPDPTTVAPAVEQTRASTLEGSLEFLYAGPDPVQRGVVAGTFEADRIAVVRGRVLDRDAAPIPGVRVSVVHAPEYGLTHTRADGTFDLVINGGDHLVLAFEHASYLSAQRAATVDWHAPVQLEPVVLTPASSTATTVQFSNTTGPQLARGDVETDVDGTRQGTLLFPSGTRAQVTLANDTVVPAESVDSLAIRITEYTVGALGGVAMPAPLPPTSAFTYAIELSADGAERVNFTKPVPYYLENFIGLPIGTEVPLGYYDTERGFWIAADNGIVLQIVGNAGGLAEIDADGDGVADSGAALTARGVTAEERQVLATTYQVGAALWRVVVDHFSTWDANMGISPPEDALGPDGSTDKPQVAAGIARPCIASGSIVECQSQALGERIALPGTSSSLNYRSDRSPAAQRSVTVKLGTTERLAAASYNMVSVEFQPENGKAARYRWMRADVPSSFTWNWDGLDAYNRPVQGRTDVDITISYHYPCVYARSNRFGYNGNGLIDISPNPRRRVGDSEIGQNVGSGGPGLQDTFYQPACSIALKQKLKAAVEQVDLRDVGIGGWSLSEHHFYDRESQLLFKGNGEKVAAKELPPIVETFYKFPQSTPVGAVRADGNTMAIGHDGALYSTGFFNHENTPPVGPTTDPALLRFDSNGQPQIYFGGGSCNNIVEGDLLDGRTVREVMQSADRPDARYLARSPSGDLYVNACGNWFQIDRGERLRLVMRFQVDGSNNLTEGTDVRTGGFPLLISQFDQAQSTADASGNFYVVKNPSVAAETPRIFMVDNAGRATTLAGGEGHPQLSCALTKGGYAPAKDVQFCERSITKMTADAEGNLFFSANANANGVTNSQGAGRVYRVDRVGQMSLVAGAVQPTGSSEWTSYAIPEDVDATQVVLSPIRAMGIDSLGRLNFYDAKGRVVQLSREGGRLYRLAGLSSYIGSSPPFSMSKQVEGAPARDAYYSSGAGATMPVGNNVRYVATPEGIRAIHEPLDTVLAQEVLVADPQGAEQFVFDLSGRHLRTLSAETGATIRTFAYDSSGHLVTVTDAYGQVTEIERGSSGAVTAIVAPHGQRTEIEQNVDGYLSRIVPEPETAGYVLNYEADGLLRQLVDPRLGVHTFEYEGGYLTSDASPDGRELTLQGTQTGLLRNVTKTETDSGSTTYVTDQRAAGSIRSEVHHADGTQSVAVQSAGGSTTTTLADGTVSTTVESPDPIVGMRAPLRSMTLKTPSGLTRVLNRLATVVFDPASTKFDWVSRSDTLSLNNKIWTDTYTRSSHTRVLRTPAGRTSTIVYDALGKPLSVSMPGRVPWTLAYDAEGRLEAMALGSGSSMRTVSLAYSQASGYLSSIAQVELNQTTAYVRDFAGRPTLMTDPAGNQIAAAYDAAGNVTSITPPGRPAHSFEYTAADLLETYTSPPASSGGAAAIEELQYTGHRLPQLQTRADGTTVSYGYRTDGKLGTRTTSRGVATFNYSATTGQLTSVSGSDGSGLAFAYDGSLPLTQTWSGGSGQVAGSAGFTYNADFRRSALRVNGSSVASYTYDADGLVTAAGTLSIQRDPASGDISTTTLGGSNGVTTQHLTNGFGEPDGLTARRGTTELFSEQVTERDARGRIIEKTETVLGVATTYRYTYDAAGRLTDVEQDGQASAHYTYDANSNRLSVTRPSGTESGTYDDQDRVVSYAGRSYSFDASGDLQSMTIGAAVTTYDYDELGNLRTVTLPDTRVITYDVDAANRRIGKRVNGVRQYGLLYQGQLAPAALLGPTNNVVATFVYATRSNVPDYMIRSGVSYRIVTDHLGSVRLVVNVSTGEIAQRLEYDEFGRVLVDTAPGYQPFGFAGGLYDADTGLVGFGARDYDSATGRWTAKDPMLFGAGQSNLYVYVGDNPVNRIDPSGLWDVFVFGSDGVHSPGPVRASAEGIAVFGLHDGDGYVADIGALGVQVGSLENYGAYHAGMEHSSTGETSLIHLIEGNVGVEIPYILGAGAGGGVFISDHDHGVFFHVTGDDFGQEGALGFGFSTKGWGDWLFNLLNKSPCK